MSCHKRTIISESKSITDSMDALLAVRPQRSHILQLLLFATARHVVKSVKVPVVDVA